MDATGDIREFLTSRRAKITPEQAGLPAYGSNRRVTGLRREEAAMLAGISVEYYTRLERGNAAGASEDVLEGVARALQLDEAERAHLFDLVRAANATSRPTRRRPAQERVRPTVQRILDSMTAPAYVRNGRLDLIAANRLGHALYAPVFEDPSGTPNMARFIFLTPRACDFFHDCLRWCGPCQRLAGGGVELQSPPGGADQFCAVAVGQCPGDEGPELIAPGYPPADLRQQCAGVRRYSRCLRRAELGGLHGSHGTGTAGQAARRRAGVRGVQRADPGTSGRAAGRGRWCRGGAPSRACAAREEADRGGAAGDVRARGADADRHYRS